MKWITVREASIRGGRRMRSDRRGRTPGMLGGKCFKRKSVCVRFFFFQAEDGIRDLTVTGVQTCALPIFAASGGNHGVAVAYAGRTLGWPATICVAAVASRTKLARIEGYGATLKIAGDRYADALAASEEWALRSGALPIHAYDAKETITGQATLGMELQEQCA